MHKWVLCAIVIMCDENASMLWCGILCILVDDLMRSEIWDTSYYWWNAFI